jgi:hypothetical protein
MRRDEMGLTTVQLSTATATSVTNSYLHLQLTNGRGMSRIGSRHVGSSIHVAAVFRPPFRLFRRHPPFLLSFFPTRIVLLVPVWGMSIIVTLGSLRYVCLTCTRYLLSYNVVQVQVQLQVKGTNTTTS